MSKKITGILMGFMVFALLAALGANYVTIVREREVARVEQFATIHMENQTDILWDFGTRQRMIVYNVTGESIPVGQPLDIHFTKTLATDPGLDTLAALQATHGATGGMLTLAADSAKTTSNSYGRAGVRLNVYFSGTATVDTLCIRGRNENGTAVKETLIFQAEALSKKKPSKFTYSQVTKCSVGIATDHDSFAITIASPRYPNVRLNALAGDSSIVAIATEISKTRGPFPAAILGYSKALCYADSTTGYLTPGAALITKTATGYLTKSARLAGLHQTVGFAIEPACTTGLYWVWIKGK